MLLTRLWDKGFTPIKTDVLCSYLSLYPNKIVAAELKEGFIRGFRLQYTGPRISTFSKNLVSALQFRDETLAKLQKEVSLGRMLGPFHFKPISNLRVSPIGLVPKPNGGWRLITNLSHPPGNSVNYFIDPDLCKVKYSSLDSVLDMIYRLGRHTKLGKIDISSAFRLLVVNPADFDLLGIYFEGKYWIDKNLPMGLGISCSLFEKFSTFIHYLVAYKSGIETLDHYLDDFIFAGAANSRDCECLMDTFAQISDELGIPLADEKTDGPTTVIQFLGFVIDTDRLMVRIPEEKLHKLKEGLTPLLTKNRVTIRDLEAITGLMSFCSRAIPSSRAFIRRFYDLIATVKNKKPHYYVKVSSEVKDDAMVWLRFLELFNGEVFIPEDCWYSSDTLKLYTDSSGNASLGCGAFFDNCHWAQFRWPHSWKNTALLKNMSFLELVPVILALFIWAPNLKNKKVVFYMDNQSLVSIVNKRTSKDKFIMKLIRPLVYLTMYNNIQFKCRFLEGYRNEIADSISRFQEKRFRCLAPQADRLPMQTPVEFLRIISEV